MLTDPGLRRLQRQPRLGRPCVTIGDALDCHGKGLTRRQLMPGRGFGADEELGVEQVQKLLSCENIP